MSEWLIFSNRRDQAHFWLNGPNMLTRSVEMAGRFPQDVAQAEARKRSQHAVAASVAKTQAVWATHDLLAAITSTEGDDQ